MDATYYIVLGSVVFLECLIYMSYSLYSRKKTDALINVCDKHLLELCLSLTGVLACDSLNMIVGFISVHSSFVSDLFIFGLAVSYLSFVIIRTPVVNVPYVTLIIQWSRILIPTVFLVGVLSSLIVVFDPSLIITFGDFPDLIVTIGGVLLAAVDVMLVVIFAKEVWTLYKRLSETATTKTDSLFLVSIFGLVAAFIHVASLVVFSFSSDNPTDPIFFISRTLWVAVYTMLLAMKVAVKETSKRTSANNSNNSKNSKNKNNRLSKVDTTPKSVSTCTVYPASPVSPVSEASTVPTQV